MSNDDEKAITRMQAQIAWTIRAPVGTCVRGETFERLRGNRPSRAIAQGTRAPVRIEVCSVPKVDDSSAAAMKVMASGPRNFWATSVATDAVVATLATSVADIAYKYDKFTKR